MFDATDLIMIGFAIVFGFLHAAINAVKIQIERKKAESQERFDAARREAVIQKSNSDNLQAAAEVGMLSALQLIVDKVEGALTDAEKGGALNHAKEVAFLELGVDIATATKDLYDRVEHHIEAALAAHKADIPKTEAPVTDPGPTSALIKHERG